MTRGLGEVCRKDILKDSFTCLYLESPWAVARCNTICGAEYIESERVSGRVCRRGNAHSPRINHITTKHVAAKCIPTLLLVNPIPCPRHGC